MLSYAPFFFKYSLATILFIFSQSVLANIAQEFGTASQGSNYGSSVASFAIDGDEGTYNHTGCNATDNWWQVSLPDPSVISRIVVKNRSGQLARLNGASVYVSASAYSVTMNEADKVHTLDSGSVQEITLPTPLSGAFVIVKASGSNCLHMTELEVYGEVPTAPQFSDHETSYSIAQTKPLNATVVTLSANDLQNNSITYSITGNVPFAVDSVGNVTVNGALAIGDIHTFDINASDGAETTSTSLTVTVKASTAPIFSGGVGHYAVAENASLNTSVGFVKATDIDLDPLTYSLKDAGTPFKIDSITGEITVSGAIDRSAGIQQTVTITVTDQASTVEQQQTIFIIPAANANTTGIYLEHWTGISGNEVSGLTSNSSYPGNPTQTSVLTSFEAPSQTYGSYGQRASGYLKVSESAEYTFWIASDDESQLRLSSDIDPANMGDPIASVDGWTSSQQWTKYESQKSAAINLVAGRLYYIEALHKEGGGGDHVAVAIQKAGDASLTLISGAQVIPPYVIDGTSPTAPTSLGSDSVSGSSVEIVWGASNDAIGIASYEIYRDNVLIATVGPEVFNYIDNNVSADTTHNYQVIAFDAFGNESLAATLAVNTATSVDSVATALQTGDARYVLNDINLVVAALAEINTLRSNPSLLTELYQTGSILYTQAQSSQLINLIPSDNTQPILLGNGGRTLGMTGVTDTSRYAAFGQVPMEMFQDYSDNPDHPFEAPFKRLLAWLIAGEPVDTAVLNTNRTVAVAFVSNKSSDINTWLNEHYGNWNIVECNTVVGLSSCLNQADLILTGSNGDNDDAAAIQQALSDAMDLGKPVVYMHNRGWGANDVSHNIASLLGFTLPYGGNYWAKDGANWDNVSLMYEQVFSALGLESIETMLTHFRDQDYNFDWSVCKDGDKLGEQYDDCGDVVGLSDFVNSASAVRSIVSGLEGAKTDIFAANGYRLEKLLVLIADKFRQSVTYPMDKVTTDNNKFMRSYYADNVVYNYRKLNPAQADMGNFSRSDFSHITPITKTVNLTSKKNFRSTGAYALPGQTFKVTRNDTSDLTVKVFINTLRSGATHQYQVNAYNRPKYLQSTYFEIASGETIELTSPYGGTLQLNFSANDLPVEVTFENVGEHAYWASSADDASFTARLNAGDFDWAEVVTSGFEVHSKLDKMRASVADTKWGTAQALANATERYMSNFPHVLAGFKGPGIDVVDEIHDFATANSLTINNLDLVKHMNADQATCGYGCSGNPYDAYWSYSPVGHGDVHELGHGLEKSRFRFAGWEGHSTTNPYSYYTKSKYNQTVGSSGNVTECQNLPFQSMFETLQASVGQASPSDYVKTELWGESSWSRQFMVTLQAMMHAQKMGKLENGWHLLARLHILEREISRADDDWEVNKASLGFSTYTLEEFNDISNNDWMLVSLSFAAGLDYRDYLTMLGLDYTQKASDQVASFNYSMVQKEFFITDGPGFCEENVNGDFLAKSTLPIDGVQVWPASTDTDGDGYWDALDNCPIDANKDQADANGNGKGDVCDPDVEAPTVTAPASLTIEATGITTPVDLGEATASDLADGTLTATADNIGPFALGTYTITWSATDSADNKATSQQTLVVQDTKAPNLTVPVNKNVSATGPMTVVEVGTATVSDLVDPSPGVTSTNTGRYAVGTHTVTWSAMDASGNKSSGIQTIVVTDSTGPVITAPTDIDKEATGSLTVISLGSAAAEDLVDGTLTATADETGPFAVGVHKITWTASDAAGNKTEAIQTVTVTDETAPDVTAPSNVTKEATGPQTGVSLGVASATDLVAGVLTATSDKTGPFEVGEHTVAWTAVDTGNIVGTATQTVTITDTTKPVLNAPPSKTVAATGQNTFVSLGAATATDLVDGVVAVSSDAPATFVLGTKKVTWTATDSRGNTATATQLITVSDGEGPTITAPESIAVEATGATTVVGLGSAIASDVVDGVLIAVADKQGPFAIGSHTVTWTATDSSGNEATAQQTVEVKDTTAPTLTAPANQNVEATALLTVVPLGTAVTSDAVDDAPIATPDKAGSFAVGTHTIKWTAKDASGNESTASQTIVVSDSTSPSVGAPGDKIIEATGIQTAVSLGTTSATDLVDGVLIATPSVIGPFTVGVHPITWTATDSANNIGTDTQTITVEDNTAPLLQVPGGLTVAATGEETRVDLGTAEATDLVDGVVIPSSDASPTFTVGTHTITWTASDAAGNAVTATQLVTVSDSDGPIITAPASVTSEASGVLTEVALGSATASSIVDGELTAIADKTGPFAVGEHTVIWTATDSQGLEVTVEQLVTVEDSSAPVLMSESDVIKVTATAVLNQVTEFGVSADDLVDGSVTPQGFVVVEGEERVLPDSGFTSGTHFLVWKASDASGNEGILNQTLEITPFASFLAAQSVGAGDLVTVGVALSGEAVYYPVTIPYIIDIEATTVAVDGSDHSAINGSIVIESGAEGSFNFFISDNPVLDGANGLGQGDLAFTLGDVTNAVKGAASSHKVIISANNIAPTVKLEISQNDQSVTQIVKDGGSVVINALATDNVAQSLSFDWSQTDSRLTDSFADSDGATFEIDPTLLEVGFYKVTAVVMDNGSPMKQVETSTAFRVVAGSQAIIDTDRDGIADNQDDIAEPNRLAAGKDGAITFIIESTLGTTLRLGDVAVEQGKINANVDLTGLPAIPSQYGQENLKVYDYKVAGMAPGESILVIIPQQFPIPANASYLKSDGVSWKLFIENTKNSIFSASSVGGVCPAVGSSVYTSGLTAGNMCIQLRIEDGGLNDSDGLVNGEVADLGVVIGPDIAASEVPNTNENSTVNNGGSGGGGSLPVTLLPLLLLFSIVRRSLIFQK